MGKIFSNYVCFSESPNFNTNINILFAVRSAISLVHMVLESVRAVVVNYESNYYFFFSVKNPNGKHLKAFGLMKDCMPKYSIVWTADNYRGAIRRPQ